MEWIVRPVAEIWPFEIFLRWRRKTETRVPRKPHPRTKHGADRTTGCGDMAIIFKLFQDGGRRHLGFVRTENSAIRSAVPENPTLEPNMEWIR